MSSGHYYLGFQTFRLKFSSEIVNGRFRAAWLGMPSHTDNVFKALQTFYSYDQFCDVSIICGIDDERDYENKPKQAGLEHVGESIECSSPCSSNDESRPFTPHISKVREIRCHRVMLCAVSDYFSAMFSLNMKEASESRVCLEMVPYNTMRAIVDYAYYGSVDLTMDNAMDLIVYANFLQISSLVELCSKFLVQSLTLSNAVLTFQWSRENNLSSLGDSALSFILDNFVSIIDVVADDINQCLSIDFLEEIVQSNSLNIPCEETVLHIMFAWMKADPENRKFFLMRLLGRLRLYYIDKQTLVKEKSTNWLLQSDKKSVNYVADILADLDRIENKCDHFIPPVLPRPSTLNDMIVIGGLEPNSTACNYMELYSPRDNSWSTIRNEMNRSQVAFGCVAVNENLFILGGRSALKTLSDVDCYTREGQEIDMDLPGLLTRRQGLAACTLSDRYIYAIGGHDGWNYLNSVEVLDLNDLEEGWISVKSMKATRSDSACAVIGDRIYVIGGRDGSSCLSSVEMFDSKESRWTYCASMMKRRARASAAVLAGYVYVVGGTDSHSVISKKAAFDSCERYDPFTNTWSSIATLPSPRRSMAVSVLGWELYAMGGVSDQSETTSTVFKYNPQTDTWIQVADLTSCRSGSKCVVLAKSQN